jgi:hypothetical protein
MPGILESASMPIAISALSKLPNVRRTSAKEPKDVFAEGVGVLVPVTSLASTSIVVTGVAIDVPKFA